MSDKTDLTVVIADYFFITVYKNDDEGITTYNPAIGLIADDTPGEDVLIVTNIINEEIDEAIKAALTIAMLLADGFSNSITIAGDRLETTTYEKTVTDFLYQGNVSFDYSKQVH
jgi:hypothetical protein